MQQPADVQLPPSRAASTATVESDGGRYQGQNPNMAAIAHDGLQQRSSAGSGRGTREKKPQTVSREFSYVQHWVSRHPNDMGMTDSDIYQKFQQQLSKIEKSVTHLLVATKQLLETLTQWSRGNTTEGEVSDIYVRLGYEFNIASRAFNEIGVGTEDLGDVPTLLRGILEETLSQEASQASLDKYLPQIRDIIINLLKRLKVKQQALRQRSYKDGTNGSVTRTGSMASFASGTENDDAQSRTPTSRPTTYRSGSGDMSTGDSSIPPRTSSVAGRTSPNKYDSLPANPRPGRTTSTTNRDTVGSTDSSLSSNTMQNMPVIAPYPSDDAMPDPSRPPYVDFPPPPPPPKQEDALAALQRGGELERRASRRFSAYQLQKLVGANGIPMMPPAQTTPIPNRGRDVRESMHAVRTRGSVMNRPRPGQRQQDANASRANGAQAPKQDEISRPPKAPELQQPPEPREDDSPMQKTPDDKIGSSFLDEEDVERAETSATLAGPLEQPAEVADSVSKQPSIQRRSHVPARDLSRITKSPSPPQSGSFLSEGSPKPGQELTLFLQYKSRIKKYVLSDAADLSVPRLQLAFIEKFAWNTHNNGVDLPEIYIQDPVSGVRHELEDLSDIKDRCVLVLNVEVLDEVKKHFDDGLGGLQKVVESIKSTIDEHTRSIQRVSDRQVDAAKEIASIAAAPARTSLVLPSSSEGARSGGAGDKFLATSAQMTEIQNIRRDLAVVRQTYSSFVADMEASMTNVRAKAANVKSTALKLSVPSVEDGQGRAYVNNGKKTLQDDSERIVNKVDDLQDLVEELRKDVVQRGVRPLARQLDSTAKDLQTATAEVKKIKDFLKQEKPVWTKIWERELQVVCDDRDLLTMQEDLATDLEDDLAKCIETFELVQQATKQQNLQGSGTRSASGRAHGIAIDRSVDPREAKDGLLGEVRALRPNHENRLEAIERAEKQRQQELESRRGGEFGRELGQFVEEGKLKKSGGVQEVERMREQKDKLNRQANLEIAQQRAEAAKEREARRKVEREAERAAIRAQEAAEDAAAAEAGGEGGGETKEAPRHSRFPRFFRPNSYATDGNDSDVFNTPNTPYAASASATSSTDALPLRIFGLPALSLSPLGKRGSMVGLQLQDGLGGEQLRLSPPRRNPKRVSVGGGGGEEELGEGNGEDSTGKEEREERDERGTKRGGEGEGEGMSPSKMMGWVAGFWGR